MMAMPQTIESYRHPFADGGFKRMLINGEWVRSASGKTFETLNPSTGQVLATVAEDVVPRTRTGRVYGYVRVSTDKQALSPEAQRAWVRFYDSFAREQADAEGAIAAMLSKVEGAAARLTLLHHVATLVDLDCDDDRDI